MLAGTLLQVLYQYFIDLNSENNSLNIYISLCVCANIALIARGFYHRNITTVDVNAQRLSNQSCFDDQPTYE